MSPLVFFTTPIFLPFRVAGFSVIPDSEKVINFAWKSETKVVAITTGSPPAPIMVITGVTAIPPQSAASELVPFKAVTTSGPAGKIGRAAGRGKGENLGV